MAKVFVSYARANEAAAAAVAKALKDQGDIAWWDKNLPAHRRYSEVLEEQLEQSDAVIVLWSKEALESEWVRAEADVARAAQKLIQVSLDGTLPPIPFNQTHCVGLKRLRSGKQHSNWAKVDESIRAISRDKSAHRPASQPKAAAGLAKPALWAIATAVLLVIGIAGYFGSRSLLGEPEGPLTLAILPFESASPENQSLADGIWEDTRTAISRNRQLRVMGRQTMDALAEHNLAPADYRDKLGVDYLLGGSIRRAGERIRMTVSLVNTRSGAEIWSQQFDRKLDDILALQLDLANEIEGRIRGRLAEKGGQLPQNIATSGATYALYSEARSLIRSREPENIQTGHRLLRKALEQDPNFAPAWAALSVAERVAPGIAVTEVGNDWEKYARRAIALAPNLAAGHAALGLALNDKVEAKQALERAVVLDGGDIESLNWLANIYMRSGQRDRALELYERAFDMDPLFESVAVNYVNALYEVGKEERAERVLAKLEGAGLGELVLGLRLNRYIASAQYAAAARYGLRNAAGLRPWDRMVLGRLLMTLGYAGALEALAPHLPPWSSKLANSDPTAIGDIDAEGFAPSRFWKSDLLPILYAQTALATGQEAKFVAHYREFARSPDELAARLEWDSYMQIAPDLAIALRRTGYPEEGDELLARAEQLLAAEGSRDPLLLATRSRILAARGRKTEAVAQLRTAVEAGFRPLYPLTPRDLSNDPAWAELNGLPEFEQIRRGLLSFLQRERASLGPVELPPN